MNGLFQPAQRRLTEEQFARRVNGTPLSHVEMQILRRDHGLPYEEQTVLNEPVPSRVAVFAWRKIMGNRAL